MIFGAPRLTLARTLSSRASAVHKPAPVPATQMPTPQATVTPVRLGDLHVSKPTWWLESRFHFSFADWYEPGRQGFGVLRVINDDLVKARSGFGTHPHRDMEIFTYVVDGELSHADSMGMKETLGRGSVQYMSAGTGVRHSEMNDGAETTRFLQLWINPDKRGHTPQYGSSTYDKQERHNRLLQILGGTSPAPSWPAAHAPQSINLHADANVYVSECDPGHTLDVDLGANRQMYAVCIEGGLRLNDVELKTREGAKIMSAADTATSLQFTAGEAGAHFLLVEMAAQPL